MSSFQLKNIVLAFFLLTMIIAKSMDFLSCKWRMFEGSPLQILILEVISDCDLDSCTTDKGIDKSIFVKPTTFHLTLLMLKLWNEDRVHAAINCLQVWLILPHVFVDYLVLDCSQL
jgi:hypothetical protein